MISVINKGAWFFSVLDGHGDDGHFVSKFISNQLLEDLELNIINNDNDKNNKARPKTSMSINNLTICN